MALKEVYMLNRTELLHQISIANSTRNPNKYKRIGSYVYLDLCNSRTAKISAKDYPKIAKFRWTAQRYRNGVYYVTAVFRQKDSDNNLTKKQIIILLHRLIRDIPDGLVIDHLDHDGLNCARRNIKVTSNQKNTARRRPNASFCSSPYRGVVWCPDICSYVARIRSKGIRYYVGTFGDAREAAIAWNRKAIEVYGKGAFQNAI